VLLQKVYLPTSAPLPLATVLFAYRRRGKNENEEKRELIFKEDGQEYAQVLRMLGNGRLEAQCIDGIKRLCHIRGKMRKKVWVNQGDIILVGLRDYQDAKGDVILKYMADEARSLKQYGELPENIRVNDTDAMMEGEENENAEYVAALGMVHCWEQQHSSWIQIVHHHLSICASTMLSSSSA
jgi:translation initiation factor 1A